MIAVEERDAIVEVGVRGRKEPAIVKDEVTAKLWNALLDQLGGDEAAALVDEHYRHGRTLAQIAADRGLSVATVHRRIRRLRGTLATHGLLPPAWRQRDRMHVSQK